MTKFMVTYLPGDGIGPEIMEMAVNIMRESAKKDNIALDIHPGIIGGKAIDQVGTAIPNEIIDLCDRSDAVLVGGVGGPKWEHLDLQARPEVSGLLKLRKMYNLFTNLCPLKVIPELAPSSSLKDNIALGTDILVVRELTGGLYFGKKGREEATNGIEAYDELRYSTAEIERIGRIGFEQAKLRSKRLVSVDKSSILETGRLWREVMTRLSKEYPDVTLTHMSIDNCTVRLISNPKDFDVIVAENTLGDILADICSGIAGSLGVMPSASMNGTFGVYKPCHGAASDIAGQDIANPIGMILSVAMMFRYSFDAPFTAKRIEVAVENVLKAGYRTRDIAYGNIDEDKIIGTGRMGHLIFAAL